MASLVDIECKVCGVDFEAENYRTKMCGTCSHQKKLDRCKKYKKKNKEHVQEYNKIYKEEHKEEIDVYNRLYNIENRQEIQERQTRTQRERRKNDPAFNMSKKTRTNFTDFVKNGRNNDNIQDLVGCSYEEFCDWIESQFTQTMNWDNYGSYWHVDHVILCCLFNMLDEEERKTCFNWQNTRPLEAMRNLKRKKLSLRDMLNQEIHLYYFKKNIDDFGHHQSYFGTKLVMKIASGLS
jgi:hypothetical protein